MAALVDGEPYEALKAALRAMQQPSQVKKVEKWIGELQNSPNAWSLWDRLLREPGLDADGMMCRLWGGKMLQNKITHSLDELDASQVAPLMQSLIGHLNSLSQRPAEMKACRFLCVSIAACAVQVNQPGVVTQVLQLLDPLVASAPSIVLELLTVLPEECDNTKIIISDGHREAFRGQLTASVDMVYGFLLSLWPNANEDTRVDILRVVERWIDLTNVDFQRLVSFPIFNISLDSLASRNSNILFRASEVLITTIHRYDPMRVSQCLHVIVPRVLSLRSMWNDQMSILAAHQRDEDDEYDAALDVCLSITKIYSAFGREYLRFIFSSTDIGQGDIVGQIIECAKFPYRHDTAIRSLKFFFDVSQEIFSAKSSPELAPVVASFTSVYVAMIGVTMKQVRLRESKFHAMQQDKKSNKVLSEDEKDDRSEWRELLLDCAQVLGGETALQTICTSLQAIVTSAAGSEPSWADIECHIMAAASVACYVPEGESTMLPWMLDFVSRLPDLGPLLGSTMELVGRLSRWLAHNHSFLPHFMNQLATALRTEHACTPAARSLKSILTDCYKVPGLPLEQMHDLLLETRTSGSLPLEADLDVIEGFRIVITNMPPGPEHQGPALQRLIEPIVASLATTVAAGADVSAAAVIPNLERLTCAMRYDPRESGIDSATVLPFFIQSIHILQAVMAAAPFEPVAEKVTRCYKHCIRNCRNAFLPYLPAMCEHLVSMFEMRQYSAFVYIGSLCVTDYGKCSEETERVLYQMIWAMSGTFFREIGSLDKFQEKPDVVEEYYFFLVRVLKTCPGQLLSAVTETSTLMLAGIAGLQLDHRDAQRGILSFFDELLRIAHDSEAHKQLATELVAMYGPQLVVALLQGLSGQVPAYAVVDDRRDSGVSTLELLYKLKELDAGQLQVRPPPPPPLPSTQSSSPLSILTLTPFPSTTTLITRAALGFERAPLAS